MAIASLILGILSIVFWFMPFVGWLGVIVGIVGIVLAIQAKKLPDSSGLAMANAGLVCSIIGSSLNLILWIACAACVGGLSSVI